MRIKIMTWKEIEECGLRIDWRVFVDALKNF